MQRHKRHIKHSFIELFRSSVFNLPVVYVMTCHSFAVASVMCSWWRLPWPWATIGVHFKYVELISFTNGVKSFDSHTSQTRTWTDSAQIVAAWRIALLVPRLRVQRASLGMRIWIFFVGGMSRWILVVQAGAITLVHCVVCIYLPVILLSQWTNQNSMQIHMNPVTIAWKTHATKSRLVWVWFENVVASFLFYFTLFIYIFSQS